MSSMVSQYFNTHRSKMASATATAAAAAPAASYPNDGDRYDYLCKLLVIGESGCGKSSLLKRFSDDTFYPSYSSTIGVDFEVKTVECQNGKKVKLQIWDTAGQERFRSITSMYYKNSNAVLIVCDVTSEESFHALNRWMNEVASVFGGGSSSAAAGANRRVSETGAPLPNFGLPVQILVVANKIDLIRSRVVESHRLQQWGDEHGVEVIETSAKNAFNVNEAFNLLAERFAEQRMNEAQELAGAPGGKRWNVTGVPLQADEDDNSGSAWKRCLGSCSIM